MTNAVATSPLDLPRADTPALPAVGTALVAYTGALSIGCIAAAAVLFNDGRSAFGAVAAVNALLFAFAAFAVVRGRADAWPATFAAGALLFIPSAFSITIVGPTWFQALGVGAGWAACMMSLALPHFACSIDAQGRFR